MLPSKGFLLYSGLWAPELPPHSRGDQVTPTGEHTTLAFRPHWDKQALGHFAVYVLHVLHQFCRLQTLPRGLMYKTVNQPAFIILVIKLGYEPPVQLPNQHPSRRARSSKHFITDNKGGIHTNDETHCCLKLPTCKQMDLTWA